jgi:2-oxo-4-hydroxy-4-carboxy-5-ureidoimidazoline decarboxylase
MENLHGVNVLSPERARAAFLRCCGSTRWANAMAKRIPFASANDVFTAADEIWARLDPADWLEAFEHHPKIGDVDSLRKKFASTATLCESEQAGVKDANETVLRELAEGNAAYEKRFGFIFIVCATGKSAAEMLAILKSRLPNDPKAELHVAAAEQAKITRLRLEKL